MAKTERAMTGRTGLRIKRYFTKTGVHPYDEIEWEIRDAIIPNFKEGGNAFEQPAVEFPKSWSQNATNIVAQKYFRGPLGTPQRERSVRQLIDRVADTITWWGWKDGYFAEEESRDVFNHELKAILVRQRAAFNSPVWFNVGSEKEAQASACQPWDALVSTPGGFVPIGEIVERALIGLRVFDAEGETRVVAVKRNGRKRVYRVKLRNGMAIEATGDHLVRAAPERRATAAWVRVDGLLPGMRLHLQRHPFEENAEADNGLVSEAALAAWLQGDGFCGQYATGTNRSLTIEFMTANVEEYAWVKQHLDVLFPDVHRKIRPVEGLPEMKRIRLYGEVLRPFVERNGLLGRRQEIRVPTWLWTAPLEAVRAYLRSAFQAEGFVSIHGGSSKVGFAVISERWTEELQLLLLRLGIATRRFRKREKRPDRSDLWQIEIAYLSERRRFADEVGFIGWDKADKLAASLAMVGKSCPSLREVEVVSIDHGGEQDVYDIQTESGNYLSNNIVMHNCFILSVDDTMQSILNWYVEEGTIFKGGSGSGVNLSSIRSSKERLSAGGAASGPVSFMRGADASAGTIKSGGKTRRAAKMIILNADHPDVTDFIWCKAVEERKARVLRDGGFDMDLDGRDSFSIQYQNANNSVRVTDEFMMAYVEERDWALKAVTTGEVIETLRARDLMRQIAQAAWECADPGMQYDTTINAWHTCPNSGRINASNPCSEYMHLDNSACNLASLNLMKFVDEDMNFDIQAFRHAIDIVFLAQEILVGNSSYPTQKIEKNAKNFRELGLGYANLGALLMARGVPYDSDAGRAWAGAITALMTGWAYRSSAIFAGAVGPFAGFAVNREPTLNILRKHRAAVDGIDPELVPEGLLQAAKGAWDDAITLGEQHGVRNSQASVLAPTGTISFLLDCDTTGVEPDLALVKTKKLVGGGTMKIVNQTVPRALRRLGYDEDQQKEITAYIAEYNTVAGAPHIRDEHTAVFDCAMGDRPIHYMGHVNMMAAVQPFISGAISKCVAGDTLVTTEDGLVRIGSLYGGEAPDAFRDHVMAVASLDGTQKTDAFYYGGVKPVREVVLRSGQRIVGTPNHRVLVATEGGLAWRRLDEIVPGEYVATRYGADMWSPIPARFERFVPSNRYGPQKVVRIPEEMTEELAFLLGAYVAEGHTTRSTWSVIITNSCEEVLERVVAAWRSEFGVDAKVTRQHGKCPGVVVSSKTIVEFLEWLECGARASAKRIPNAVLRSPRSMVVSFLQGLALDAYVALNGASPKWAICVDSAALLNDLQAVLNNLGVVHSRIEKANEVYGKSYGEVYAAGEHAQALIRMVPFVEHYKRDRAQALLSVEPRQSTMDVVPGLDPRALYDLIPRGKSGRNGFRSRTPFSFLRDPRTTHVSMRTLERVAALPGVVLPEWLSTVLADRLHFSPVDGVGDAGMREVFDVSVPITHAFVGNGIVNHNTVNVPESVTVEEIEQLFVEGWRLGLKAIAIYRDNCKVAQPLSADKKKTERAPDPAVIATGRPQRKRLPKSRPSRTVSFRVADAEGYITAGEYPDDGLGEIFLKVSKQGSTLSGIMDALAISISVGLQYGVPLEEFVAKFMNMRFEPSGMTDDPDVRFATSLADYVFRRLALDYLDEETRARLGIFSTGERRDMLQNGHATPEPQALPEPLLRSESEEREAILLADAPLCYNCGNKMRPSGSCYVCEACGSTSGCS